ncbi:MAG: flagellar hook-associated protein 3 [Clostridiaceae bacterium]|nr:flagellar hook-associated protein 3 [Clostridiaceae bacterium]
MRVTNKMLSNNFLSDMNRNLNNLQTLQKQMTSGKNFTKPSDDPFNVARSMQMHTSIGANKQYNKNITNTINWMDTTDTALGQLGNVFQAVREKLVSAGNAAYGSDERNKIKDEINQRIGQISQILNTSFDGEYIFGGTRATSKPVDAITDSKVVPVTMDSSTTGGKASVSGTFYGSGKVTFKIEAAAVDTSNPPKVTKVNVLKSTDGGTTYNPVSSPSAKSDGTFDIGNGLTFTIPPDMGNKADPTLKSTYTFDCESSGNTKLVYLKEDGTELDPNSTDPASQDTIQLGMIKSNRQTEISQGVLVKYNVSAENVISYTKKDGSKDDIRNLLQRIVNHLDGKDDTGNALDPDAVKKLTNQDLKDIDDAMSQILKTRSEVGAMQNRMDSAKDQNEQSNYDMTDILSKTEDIDITEKTMEFATMQTVYLASLQTSAKVLQPTLMDYMR